MTTKKQKNMDSHVVNKGVLSSPLVLKRKRPTVPYTKWAEVMQKHLQPPLNEEDEEKYKPILIAECVSREYFLKYGELSHVHRLNLIGDKLFIFESPGKYHEQFVVLLTFLFRDWNGSQYMKGYGGGPISVGNNLYDPDASFVPIRRQTNPVDYDGQQYPTVVFEVGVSQSLTSLHSRAAIFLSPQTTIQMYIAIKPYPRRGDNTMVMIALAYRRPLQDNAQPQPSAKISFGTAEPLEDTQVRLKQLGGANPRGLGFCDSPLTQRGTPLYQLVIPKEDLFHGVPEEDMPKRCSVSEWLFPKVTDWIIDLWNIQQMALDNL
jgi:Uma2 family endonuclease